jgi:hypothetical protein
VVTSFYYSLRWYCQVEAGAGKVGRCRALLLATTATDSRRKSSVVRSGCIWLYHRFCLSFRDTEDLLAQRGITVSYEAIRQWCQRFGPAYARILRHRQGRLGDTWHLDELFVNITVACRISGGPRTRTVT